MQILYFLSLFVFIAAIGEYHEVKRELSRISRQSTHASKIEEGAVVQEEFNLDDFLHGMNSDAEHAGHTPKHLGVVWKNLTVKVHIIIV